MYLRLAQEGKRCCQIRVRFPGQVNKPTDNCRGRVSVGVGSGLVGLDREVWSLLERQWSYISCGSQTPDLLGIVY
jgi:hypothetical protein